MSPFVEVDERRVAFLGSGAYQTVNEQNWIRSGHAGGIFVRKVPKPLLAITGCGVGTVGGRYVYGGCRTSRQVSGASVAGNGTEVFLQVLTQ